MSSILHHNALRKAVYPLSCTALPWAAADVLAHIGQLSEVVKVIEGGGPSSLVVVKHKK